MKKILSCAMCAIVVNLSVIIAPIVTMEVSATLSANTSTPLVSKSAEDLPTDVPTDSPPTLPELYFSAVNPGYKIDDINNAGEMIEISLRDHTSSDHPFSLASYTIDYTNSSGNTATLVEFPEHSVMTGEKILLRYASSPEHEQASLNYTKTLAFSGGLTLRRGGEVVDSVCWTGKEGCAKAFRSAEPTVLVRDMTTGIFTHQAEYTPTYDPTSYRLANDDLPNESHDEVTSQCRGLEFSEVLSYYDETQSEQFVEFHNRNAEQTLLDGCLLRYKSKTHPLTGIVRADGYYARYLTDFAISKNPTNVGVLELIDTDGATLDRLEYPSGQRRATSYALIGYDGAGVELWRTTFAPTPGEPNNYQEYRTCEDGKVINEATGNCVKPTAITEKTCADGYFLNPLTGRCKKIEVATVTTCKEGYELNPDTNRCRKIKDNTGIDHPVTTEAYEEHDSFNALYLVLAVVAVGVAYIIYEFRTEILRLFRKVFG